MLETLTPRLIEYGALGVVVLLEAAAIVFLFLQLNRAQDLRVTEAKSATTALNKAAEAMEQLTEIVKVALSGRKSR